MEPPKLVGVCEVPEPAFKIVNVPIGLCQLPPGGFRRSAFSGEPHVGSRGPPPNTRAFPPPISETNNNCSDEGQADHPKNHETQQVDYQAWSPQQQQEATCVDQGADELLKD